MSEFKLTRSEINDPLWQKLKAHFEECIQTNRELNDNDLDETRTARTRATIRVYKELIDLETDREAG